MGISGDINFKMTALDTRREKNLLDENEGLTTFIRLCIKYADKKELERLRKRDPEAGRPKGELQKIVNLKLGSNYKNMLDSIKKECGFTFNAEVIRAMLHHCKPCVKVK